MTAPVQPPAAATFVRERVVRFSDCDPAGIVFYPQYFVMFNALVEDWVTDALGVSYAELIGPRRVGLPTVRLEVDFRAVSRHGDTVRLALQVERLGSKSLTLQVACRGGPDDELRVQLRQVLVTTSLQTHRAVDMPPDLRAGLLRWAGGHAAL